MELEHTATIARQPCAKMVEFSMSGLTLSMSHISVPPVHVVSSHVDTDKLTTANGGTFTSSSASLSSQSR